MTVDVRSRSAASGPGVGGGAPAWTLHARATVRTQTDGHAPAALALSGVEEAFPDEIDVADYYRLLRTIGLTYGPAFRGLTRLLRRDGAAIGLATLPADVAGDARYHLHPALLDACFHVLGVALAPLAPDASDELLVPVALHGVAPVSLRVDQRVVRRHDPRRRRRHAAPSRPGSRSTTPMATLVATVERLEVRRTRRSLWERAAAADRQPLYEVAWRPQPRARGAGR